MLSTHTKLIDDEDGIFPEESQLIIIIIIIIIIILFHYHKGLRAVGLSLPTGSLGFVTLSFNCISQRCINYESHQEEYPIRNKRDRGGTGGDRMWIVCAFL